MFFKHSDELKVDLGDLQSEKEHLSIFLRSQFKIDSSPFKSGFGEKARCAVDKSRMREAKRIRARDSLIVQEGNQNKKQSKKQSEKRNKKTNKPNEKQIKKGMAAEVKRKMTNYEFLMSYSPPLSPSQITEISQK